jgi:hypothetical protein
MTEQMPYGPPPGFQTTPKTPGGSNWTNTWRTARTAGWRGVVVLVLLALLCIALGTGIGTAAGQSKGTKEAAAARSQRDQAVAAANRDRDAAVAKANQDRLTAVATAKAETDKVLAAEEPAKAAARKAELDYTTRSTALTGGETALKDQQAQLTQREAAVKQREDAVGAAEQGLRATAFAGDGLFIVGHDIQAGTYQSPGPATPGGDCYYSRLSSTNTADIIANNGTSGPNIVTVSPGDVALSVSGCQDFKKIG